MRTDCISLYEHFHMTAPAYADGRLHAWGWETEPLLHTTGRKRPAVLLIPGGAYHHVATREAEPVAMHFFAQGYQVFSLEYGVVPAKFPLSLREAAMAMRYIRENAEQWEVDAGMVAAVGFSAGGHLCGTLGMLYDSEEVADIAPAAVIRPDALGLCYPVAVSSGKTHAGSFDNLVGENAALRQRLSLDKCVRPDMPPAFLWHTRTDGSVPVRNCLLLAQAMDEQGVPFALHVYNDGPHGLATADAQSYLKHRMPAISPDVPEWMDKMMSFFAEMGFCITDEEENA